MIDIFLMFFLISLAGYAVVFFFPLLNKRNQISTISQSYIYGISLLSLICVLNFYLKIDFLPELYFLILSSIGFILFSISFSRSKTLSTTYIFILSMFSIYFLTFFHTTEIRHSLMPDLSGYIGVTLDSTSSQYIIEAQRLGITLLSSTIYKNLNINIFDIYSFNVFAFLYCSIFLCFEIFKKYISKNIYKQNPNIPLLISINISLLYFYENGFYPHIIAVGSFSLFFFLYLTMIRKQVEFHKLILPSVMILIPIITNYYESIFLLFFTLLILTFFNYNSSKIINYLKSLIFLLVVLLILFPHSKNLISHIFLSTSNLANIGYTMPGNLFPSDLVGITNIFSEAGKYLDGAISARLVKNSNYNFFYMKYLLSIWVLINLFLYIKNDKKNLYSLSIIFALVFIFFVNFFLDMASVNYLYTKSATFYIIPLSLIFYDSFLYNKTSLNYRKGSMLIIKVLVIFSFSYYLQDRNGYEATINKELYKEKSVVQKYKDDYVFLMNRRGNTNGNFNNKLRYIHRSNDFIVVSMLNIQNNYIDEWLSPNKLFFQNKKIAYILNVNLIKKTNVMTNNNILFDEFATKSYGDSKTINRDDISEIIHLTGSWYLFLTDLNFSDKGYIYFE